MPNVLRLEGSVRDSHWVLAVMHFPNDAYLRNSWYAVQCTKLAVEVSPPTEQFALDRQTIDRLIDAPSHAELERKTTEAVKKAIVAGDLLASIYLMHECQIPEPSLRKAIHIMERFSKLSMYQDETPLPSTKKTIKAYFREYESVAHYWSAFRLNEEFTYSEGRQLFKEDLAEFLSVSAGQLEFGRSFVPYRSRPPQPLLNSPDIWEPPANTRPARLKLHETPDLLLELLSDYEAPLNPATL